MTIEPYKGLCPSNVAKDAKYSMSVAGEVRLTYRIDARTKDLLTTSDHPVLARMVNDAKKIVNKGLAGGVFYINEFSTVIVPGQTSGQCIRAGHYDGILEFVLDGEVISPRAPSHLRPGDDWPGPHAGIAYVLCAGGDDVRYELKQGSRVTSVYLSDELKNEDKARKTAARIAAVKGQAGGKFYINEQCEMFAPVPYKGGWRFLYVGHLEDSDWFPDPGDVDTEQGWPPEPL